MKTTRQAGFTLIEVMVAVGIMTVGAVGIMALQQTSTRGNMEARQMTSGVERTRTWLEHVRRDSLRWIAPLTTDPNALLPTVHLQRLPPVGTTGWFLPDRDPQDSYAASYVGVETRVPGDMHYCTHLRLTWIVVGDTARVEARTFWPRRDDTGVFAQQFPDCARGNEAGVTAELAAATSRLRSVQAATIVRWTPMR